MAEPVNGANDRFAIRAGFLIVAMLAPLAALSEGFVDPTRPPASMVTITQEAGATKVFSGPVLQSVIIGPGRSVAFISGEAVKVGEKFGDAILVKITESEVVLRTGDELKTLRLYPGIDKRLVPEAATVGAAAVSRREPGRNGSKPERQRQ
jgi:MSHA biogenesis protein MshK